MGFRLLDCADHTPNCSLRNQTVDADPDIAGIGVVIGFLSTTCLAFLIAFSVLFLDRYEKFVNLIRKTRGNKQTYVHDVTGPYWRSPLFWSKVLSKNLLAFSDTQLLTGLAVQFTAMLRHCSMSVYHFQIVTELAFLTTVTHLLTVVVLRNYFVKNKWINLPRVFFMLGNLALLGYTSFVSYSYHLVGLDLSSNLACFFQAERPRFTSAFGGKWATLLIGAIGGHVTVIAAMYLLKEEKLKKGEYSIKWIGAVLRTWIIAPAYAIYGIYMAGISIKKSDALGEAPVVINGSERIWGFGQFLPVLLLALPIFAGWETFWEEKDKEHEKDEDRYGRRTHHGSRNGLDGFDMTKYPNTNSSSPSHLRDNSTFERTVESNGPSPRHTPRLRSTESVAVPMPSASPRLGPPVFTVAMSRPRSPSRFEEQLR